MFFIAAFIIGAVILLSRTPFGRRVYGIGNGVRAARLSGIAVGRTLIWVYVLSALCSCLVGILLTGFSGQASLGMGDDYLLPSIAVVVVGGTHHHRRPRPISRHARRRAALDRAADHARRQQSSLRDAGNPLWPCGSWGGDRTA